MPTLKPPIQIRNLRVKAISKPFGFDTEVAYIIKFKTTLECITSLAVLKVIIVLRTIAF